MVSHASDSGVLGADEFLSHPAAHERTELVRGCIRMMTPASAGHGLVTMNVSRLLSTYVRQHRLGMCFADSTGFVLPNLPNTVRAPDASFMRADRLPVEGVSSGFLHLAPDLAIEVLSPSESDVDMEEKLADYRTAGTLTVWVIDPVMRTVTIVSTDPVRTALGNDDALTGGDVVPGFACGVAELFEGLAPTTAPRGREATA